MFSVSGSVVSGSEKKNGVILGVSKEQHEKILSECRGISHIFSDSQQPIFPTWEYNGNYYAKLLLSKARKDQYDNLLRRVSFNEQLFNVRIMPYSFSQAHSGTCNGYSLYYQGEFNVPKKFKKNQVPLPELAAQEPL